MSITCKIKQCGELEYFKTKYIFKQSTPTSEKLFGEHCWCFLFQKNQIERLSVDNDVEIVYSSMNKSVFSMISCYFERLVYSFRAEIVSNVNIMIIVLVSWFDHIVGYQLVTCCSILLLLFPWSVVKFPDLPWIFRSTIELPDIPGFPPCTHTNNQ